MNLSIYLFVTSVWYLSKYVLSNSLSLSFLYSFPAPSGCDSHSFTRGEPWSHGNYHQVGPTGRRPRQPSRCFGHGPWTAPSRPADTSTRRPDAQQIQAGGIVTGTDPVHPRRLRGGGGRDGAAGQRRTQLQEYSPPSPHQSEGREDRGGGWEMNGSGVMFYCNTSLQSVSQDRLL